MQGKSLLLILALGVFVTMGLVWTHLKRIDLDATSKIEAAENNRHGYVISHDFGFLKEKLIESHRDQWQDYSEMQRLIRWELAAIIALLVIFSVLVFNHLRFLKKIRPGSLGNV